MIFLPNYLEILAKNTHNPKALTKKD